MGLAEVSTILWRERELLELLLFKLEVEQLLLAAGKARWVARATHEVEVVLAEIRGAELLRSAEVQTAGEALGLGPEPSLRQLADAVDEPWATLFKDHRTHFMELTAEIQALARLNHELLTAGLTAAQDALASLAGAEPPAVSAYGANGRRTASAARPAVLDQAI